MRFKTATDLTNSFNPVPKNERKKNKKLIVRNCIYDEVCKRDNGRCRLCGSKIRLQLHHIDGRGKELTNNIDNCIMLCMNCHLNIVHKNQKKYRPILKELIKNGKMENN